MLQTMLHLIQTVADRLPSPVPRRQLRELRENNRKLLRTLASSREELQWELSVSAAMRDLSILLNERHISSAGMASAVLDQARHLTASTLGHVTTVDPGNGSPMPHSKGPVRCSGFETPELCVELEYGSDGWYRSLWGEALTTGRPFFTNAPDMHPAAEQIPCVPPCLQRFLAVPVQVERQTLGQIAVANSPRAYTDSDLKAVQRLAELYALALERKYAQRKTEAALVEKEVLLREVHHRVKNNLQVISSLLNLQAGLLNDERVVEMLRDSQNRVRSMALVHEQLHRSKDLSRIHFGDYVRNLTASLFSAYGVRSNKVALRLEIDNVFLPIDTAIPCGLIIHELVSNSLRHAFPGERGGNVRISLREDAAGRKILNVEDDGVGWPADTGVEQRKSLGLRLVGILADQMDATVTHETNPGVRFCITIPKSS